MQSSFFSFPIFAVNELREGNGAASSPGRGDGPEYDNDDLHALALALALIQRYIERHAESNPVNVRNIIFYRDGDAVTIVDINANSDTITGSVPYRAYNSRSHPAWLVSN